MKNQLRLRFGNPVLDQLHSLGGTFFGLNCIQPDQFSTNNHLVAGMPGTGKTLTFGALMQTELPLPYREGFAASNNGSRRSGVFQSVVYDAKSEQIPRLMALGFTPGVNLFALNPFDLEHGMVWDLAKDITDYKGAEKLAALLVPEAKSNQSQSQTSEHFQDTARRVVTEVIQVLVRGQEWTLRDLINCCQSRTRIQQVLKHHPNSHAATHINANDEGRSTLSTLKRHLDKFMLAAACWDVISQEHGQARKISLSEWVIKGRGTVLVLPDGDENPTITKPFNRFIMQRLKGLMMSPEQKAAGRRRTIFFDELPTAGHIDVLISLLTKGRDYGINISIGIQDICQMRREFGNEATDTIINACGSRAFMKCKGAMAEWCSQQIGRQVVEYISPNATASQSSSNGSADSYHKESRVTLPNQSYTTGTTAGHSIVRTEQSAVMPSEFSQMPDIKSSQVVPGYYEIPNGRMWRIDIPLKIFTKVILRDMIADENRIRGLIRPRGPGREEQVLRAMTEDDCQRLRLKRSILTGPEPAAKKKRRRRPKRNDRRPPTQPPPSFND